MVEAEGNPKEESRRENKDREITLRFRLPKLVPEQTKQHLRAARRELLLAARSMIDSAIENMEEPQHDQGTRTTRIDVQ